jgi:hypothetical protein
MKLAIARETLLNGYSWGLAISPRRWIRGMAIACLTGILFLLHIAPAQALIPAKLSNVTYHECSPEVGQGSVTPGGTPIPANCFIITATAQNDSGKTIYDADIFGRIYDANEDSVLRNRTRVGSVDEIPPGTSPIEVRISVAANQPTPLTLKQFKAAGFTAKVRNQLVETEDLISPLDAPE